MPSGFFTGAELQMVQPPSLIPKCGACGLYKACKSPKMEPSGKGRKRVLIVAEAPGQDEDSQGTQLVGKSGQFLNKKLREIGVDMRRDCHLTNALICRPPNNEITNHAMIEYCRPNLLATIERLQPDTIILLGAVAVKSLIGYCWSPYVDNIARWVGWRIPAQRINAWICPTWHPSFLLRAEQNRTLEAYFVKHLRQAFKLEGKPFEEVPDYVSQVRLVYEAADAADFLDSITSGVVAFDYECNMLKPDGPEASIVSCSVCWNGKDTIAFPMYGKAVKSLKRLLGNPDVKKIASNMKYEDRWSKAVLGVRVRGWHIDTMLASHLLDCRRHITSLKFQSFVRLGQPRYDSHIEPYLKTMTNTNGANTPNKIRELPLRELLTYNGLDSLLEFLVAAEQCKELGLRPII